MDDDTPAAPSTAPNSEATPPAAPVSIPKPRFDEVNTRMQTAETRVAQLEAELAQARAQQPPAAPAPATPAPAAPAPVEPEPTAEPTTRTSAVDERDRQIARLSMIVEQNLTAEQADALISYTDRGLSPQEARTLAEQANPQLFGRDARGFDPNAHSAAPPGSRPPRPPAEPTFHDQLAATRDPVKRQSMALKQAASMVSAQIHGQLDRRQ